MAEIQDPGPPLSLERIAEVEAELGVVLPDEYRAFLRELNGGSPVPDTVAAEGAPEMPTDVQVLFGIGRDIATSNLQWYPQEVPDAVPDGCLPIGCDSFGNLFCLKRDGSIVYVELDRNNGGIYFVAASFGDFLRKLTPWPP
jgi:hypothetical protein